MKLCILYLTDQKRHFTFAPFLALLNVSARKGSWTLMVLTHGKDASFYVQTLQQHPSIAYSVVPFPEHNNYVKKLAHGISFAEQYGIPYVMKCDNDVFLTPSVLDYMVDNLHVLEDSQHLTLGPTVSSGIPGVEYFKDTIMHPEARRELEALFMKTCFRDAFHGADYAVLNRHTLGAARWDKDAFFEGVRRLATPFKGIHPIRVNDEALRYLNTYIVRHRADVMRPRSMRVLDSDNSAYLCNTVFCIKPSVYKEVLSDPSLHQDGYDEVALNQYACKHNKKHLFVENGVAIHMYYNWNTNYIALEKQFCKAFFS
jgi:hypothetical protein